MYRDFCSKIRRINVEYRPSPHLCVGVRECVVRESACMACKRSPVRSRYSPPLAQIRVTNTVDFKSKSTVFLCLSASKFIAILQILCKIKVEVHMDLVSAINFYPADKLADDHLFCFKAGTIVQVCVRDQFFVQLRWLMPYAAVSASETGCFRSSLYCHRSGSRELRRTPVSDTSKT